MTDRTFATATTAFWKQGLGATAWGNIGGRRVLIALVPDLTDGEPYEVAVLYTLHAEGNWTRPGPVDGWDFDLARPTLSPSVQMPRGGWHGYIRDGRVVGLDGTPVDAP